MGERRGDIVEEEGEWIAEKGWWMKNKDDGELRKKEIVERNRIREKLRGNRKKNERR